MELATRYNPSEVEPQVAQAWADAGAFHAQPNNPSPPYCIVIPPPNVTAALHLGHALNNTLQDILIRWRRMAGDNAVWIPGTDHAGIATQTVVEKRVLADEGKKRTDFQRDEFVAKIQAWKDEYEKRITEQLRLMGCSCDWDRQRFTMDDMCACAVREAFFKLFKDGLIYRGKRLVNWDPATQTALADDEVEMRDVDGHFWYLKYPLAPGSDSVTIDGQKITHVTVATTRPETMLGDTAVAINPKDHRAAALVGKHVLLPIVNRTIPIIADDYVVLPDPDSDDAKARFATGFLKVTPAHDQNDYEIGLRHDLEIINIMAPDGSISDQHGWPDDGITNADTDAVPLGLDRDKARKAIVDWFRKNNLLEEVRPYRHAVGHSYRSHVPIEPYYTDQWYVKVTDDRLANAALRALARDQSETSSDTSRDRKGTVPPATNFETNRDRKGAVPPVMPPPANHYLITFTTYGSWLHGDAKGSVDKQHNTPGSPFVPENKKREHFEQDELKHDPVTLDTNQRRCVRDTIQEVCRHRGWQLHACNIRTNHAHIVVGTDDTPEKAMNDFKAYATRRLNERGWIEKDLPIWTRHGSTRHLDDEPSVEAACRYVLDEQGDDQDAIATDNGQDEKKPLPHGRGSPEKPWHGKLRFTPDRYAKTFQTWHENIRDWCISRQLWWGHRIPVWFFLLKDDPGGDTTQFRKETLDWFNQYARELQVHGDIEIRQNTEGILRQLCSRTKKADEAINYLIRYTSGLTTDHQSNALQKSQELVKDSDLDFSRVDQLARRVGERFITLEQDPDVLDTWFSSALWPFSTLGWPDDTPELNTWNPGAVLCTAREIITLWVSRMVMLNLYLLDRLPFNDVFIHAMIQDGDGRKMSKSLGNGVDPLDIIASHGSDAMRFTLAAMTTQTQDVRLPVVKDPKTGRNTSDKFDTGRNFANKVWNATRFALTKLAEAKQATGQSPAATDDAELQLVDKWILSRLAVTVRDATTALDRYDFHSYAQGLYDFFWRDLCDRYIEAVKPTVTQNPAQQRMLALCIDASLRLLHPVMPFVTEKLWEKLNDVAPVREVSGVQLHPSALLVHATWPQVAPELIDEQAEAAFALVTQIVTALRQVRTTHKVAPRQTVTFSAQAPPDTAQEILEQRQLIETLANVVAAEVGPRVEKPNDAAETLVGSDIRLYLHSLIDADAERTRLTKQLDEAKKNIAALNGRLANKSYIDKAPPHLVAQTRDQLATAVKEADTLGEQLAALG